MYDDLSDARLMSMIQAGNHEAFAVLVQRHTDRFFALALRTLQQVAEAEDAVQTAFLKLWQNPHGWSNDKNTQFTTWFYRVVLNHCHDVQRKAKPMLYQDFEQMGHRYEQEDSLHYSSQADQLEHHQEQRWRQYCLEGAIAQLPVSQRDALNLVVYSELSQEQAAQVLNVTVKALESLLFRARRSVKQRCETLNREQKHLSIPSQSAQAGALSIRENLK